MQTLFPRLHISKSAVLSNDGIYRYCLTRTWDHTKGTVCYIGLNPSTADETEDDPTIRRCVGFAKSWGYGGIIMLNLFAYRATKPVKLLSTSDPVGPDNDAMIEYFVKDGHFTIACWGMRGEISGRDQAVKKMVPRLHHLGLTKDGHPRHPLYLPGDIIPTIWE
jgi:hypothetical protein